MASRTISDFTTLASLQDTDLLLVSSSGGTYTVPVSLFKDAAKSALSDEIIGVLEQLEQSGAQIEVVTSSQWGTITGNITTQADLQQLIQSINSSINLKIDRSEATALLNTKANSSDVYTKQAVDDLIAAGDYISNGTESSVTLNGNFTVGGDMAIQHEALLKTVRITLFSSVTIAANGTQSSTYTITSSDIGEGWTAIGIVGYSMGQQTFNVYRLRLAVDSTDTIEYSVCNIDSSQHTGSLGVMVLCIRTSFPS